MNEPGGQAHRLLAFLGLTFLATALLHGAIVSAGLPFSLAPDSPALYLYLCGLAVPSIVAIALTRSGSRRAFLERSFSPAVPAAPYLAAVLIQGAVIAMAWVLLLASGSDLRPRISLSPEFAFLAVGQLWVVLGEELGWRGFALPRLIHLCSASAGTFYLALAWGAWHLPMFFVPSSLQATMSPWLFSASILAWSGIHTLLYQRAKPSVLPNMLFHASANLTLNLGLVGSALEPYLLAVYLGVAALSFAALRTRAAA